MNRLILLCLAASLIAFAQDPVPEQDLTKVDADYALQGEYSGVVDDQKVGVQIIALGDGQFRSVRYLGGLPGDGWDGGEKMKLEAKKGDDGTVLFDAGEGYTGLIKGGAIHLAENKAPFGRLPKVERKSPTLGAKPPAGAVVIFDGSNLDHFQKGAKMTPEGLLIQGVKSTYTHQSAQIHLEFRTPYKPKARGQGRGNSGFYIQGRYEVQVLDSFGLEGKMNETGGIYSIKDPDLNMCFPPLTWQTYDIDFTAATFDESGTKIKNGRMTVRLNGVVVQDDVELTHKTTAAPNAEGPAPGYIYLQNHGNPVRYRNIWVVPND